MSEKKIRLPVSALDPDERAAAIKTAYAILCQLMRRNAPRNVLEEVEQVFRECELIE